MSMADASQFESEHLSILASEILLLEQLNATLAAEKDAISARDIESLRSNGEAKRQAIESISLLEQRRRELTAARSIPETEREQARVGDVRRLTRLCSEQNSGNDALLRAERRFVDSLLNLLRGGSRASSDVYGADAELSKTAVKRLPLASA